MDTFPLMRMGKKRIVDVHICGCRNGWWSNYAVMYQSNHLLILFLTLPPPPTPTLILTLILNLNADCNPNPYTSQRIGFLPLSATNTSFCLRVAVIMATNNI